MCRGSHLHDDALAPTSGLTRILALLHLGDHELKCLLDVLVVPRARLGPRALELLGEGLALLGCDLALLGAQVRLVADYDERDEFGGLRAPPRQPKCVAGGEGTHWVRSRNTHEVVEDLVADDAGHLEALLARDRVDNHVPMDADEVLRVQDAVFILDGVKLVSWFLGSLSVLVRTRRKSMLGSNGSNGEQWGDRVGRVGRGVELGTRLRMRSGGGENCVPVRRYR